MAVTIGKGMVDIKAVTATVILAGLGGAIIWNMITWYFGLPSSSSHALIGGYSGAAIVKSGFGVIIVSGWYKTLLFIVLAPVIGLVLGFILKIISTCGFSINKVRCSLISGRGFYSFFRLLFIVWATVAMTRKKRWGSSPAFFLRGA